MFRDHRKGTVMKDYAKEPAVDVRELSVPELMREYSYWLRHFTTYTSFRHEKVRQAIWLPRFRAIERELLTR